MRTYYATFNAKTADDAVKALQAWEATLSKPGFEVEVRQIVPFGQQILVLYATYDRGTLK